MIVLDVMMPFMDGLEVTRRLRRQHIQTPILLLTARDAPEEIVRGLDRGSVFTVSMLRAAVTDRVTTVA